MRSLSKLSILLLCSLAFVSISRLQAREIPDEPVLGEEAATLKCVRLLDDVGDPRDALVCRPESDAKWAAMEAFRAAHDRETSPEELARLKAEMMAAIETYAACEGRFAHACIRVLTTRFER